MEIERRFEFKVRVTIRSTSEEDFWKRVELVKHGLRWFTSRTNHTQELRAELVSYTEAVDVVTNANISEKITA